MMRQCWICYLEEEPKPSDPVDKWLEPCLCKGSTQWVHQDCLLDWIESMLAKQTSLAAAAGGPLVTPSNLVCPQCHMQYKIKESYLIPRPVLKVLDWILGWKDHLSPAALGFSIGASVWLVAFAYGAATFTVSVGIDEALAFFTRQGRPIVGLARSLFYGQPFEDRFALLVAVWRMGVGISFIPAAILSQRFRLLSVPVMWGVPLFLVTGYESLACVPTVSPNLTAIMLPYAYDVYRYLRTGLKKRLYRSSSLLSGSRSSVSTPTTTTATTSSVVSDGLEEGEMDEDEETDLIIRVGEESIITLLVFPAASALTGFLLFRHLSLRPFHRTCLGGLVLTVAADLGTGLYEWQAEYLKRSRRVLNYQH